MEPFVLNSRGSFIEEKDFSIVWHYRNVEQEAAMISAEQLIHNLGVSAQQFELQILPGNKIIEVRQCGINKGSFIKRTLQQKHFEFILAIGDDRTDEDMFEALEGIRKCLYHKSWRRGHVRSVWIGRTSSGI